MALLPHPGLVLQRPAHGVEPLGRDGHRQEDAGGDGHVTEDVAPGPDLEEDGGTWLAGEGLDAVENVGENDQEVHQAEDCQQVIEDVPQRAGMFVSLS